MSRTNNGGLYRGRLLSKALGLISFLLLIFGAFQLITLRWIPGIPGVVLSIITAFISYRLAGGWRNPAIWKDKDLYDLLKYLVINVRKAKIGFHSFRDQKPLLVKLESIGVMEKPSEDIRQFIRNKIITDREAFDACRDYIIVETVYDDKEYFWDGYGNRKAAQYFHESEIIFNIDPSVSSILVGLLEDQQTRLPEGGNEKMFGRSQIEKTLEEDYTNMFSQQPTGMTVAQVRPMVKDAIEGCKRDAAREGTDKLPDNYGDLLLKAAESGDPDAKKIVERARNEGCTDEDIREYWNLHDLQRRMVRLSEDFFRGALSLALADSKQKSGVSGLSLSEEEKDDMVATLWKTFPKYRDDPTDTRFSSGDDRPLPHELRGRVDRWRIEMINEEPEKYKGMIDKYSSFNAMVRDEIRKGNL